MAVFRTFDLDLQPQVTTFAFPSDVPPPPFPKARAKKKRKPPDKREALRPGAGNEYQAPWETVNVNPLTEADYHRRTRPQQVAQVPRELSPRHEVWVPGMNRFLPWEVARANQWEYVGPGGRHQVVGWMPLVHPAENNPDWVAED